MNNNYDYSIMFEQTFKNIDDVLWKEGVGELDQNKLPHLLELKYNTVSDAAELLGSVSMIREAFVGFQRYLY